MLRGGEGAAVVQKEILGTPAVARVQDEPERNESEIGNEEHDGDRAQPRDRMQPCEFRRDDQENHRVTYRRK